MSGDHNQHQKDKSYLDDMDRYKQVRELVKDPSLRVTEIAWKTGYNKGHVSRLRKEAMRQALETEQEPVAWLKTWSDGSVSVLKTKSHAFADHELEPLYTAPPKAAEWVGLTDGDMEALFLNEDGVRFARYIEAKLKEKNT